MHINNIYIDNYKNIVKQALLCSHSNYTTLIGLNGSGKSNWLEAISAVFLSLYLHTKSSINYRIDYNIGDNYFVLTQNNALKNEIKVSYKDIILPDKVIACYSGEDQRLWNNFYKPHYDRFFNDAIKNIYKEPEMIYINKYHWVIALISMLCSDNDGVKRFLSAIFDVSGDIDLSSIEVKLKYNADNIDKFKTTEAATFVRRMQAEVDLRMSHIASFEIGAKNNEEFCRKVYFYFYLLFLPKINDTNRVGKAIEGINIEINGYNIDSLSEGHKKLILIKFATQIIGTKNSLILLDEPDAHTHIASKRDILSSVINNDSQTILTTHSPIFIEMMDFDSLRYIENGIVLDMDRIKAITQISDNEISVLEGALIAASKKLIVTEGPDDVKHLRKAINVLSKSELKYKALAEIPIVFQGGAKMAKEYFKSVLEPVYDNIDKIIFVFDYDSEGREGAKMIDDLCKEKVGFVYYSDSYPIISTMYDFYLEDFYPASVYSEIILPHIEDKPKFFQMKKCASLTKSIKEKIQKKINNNQLKDEDFVSYKPFLEQLLLSFNF